MKLINCEHPTMICNPHLKDLILSNRCYVMNGRYYELTLSNVATWFVSFPYTLFAPKRLGITLADIDNYYVYNKETGELFPMYIPVPCGKCLICRDRKKNDWAFRALCESQFSDTLPIFVTLTYNDACLPSHGVSKDDIQRFLKRLRYYLECDYPGTRLRYFFCSEYGKNTHRAHYHGLLFRLPHLTYPQLLGYVRRAWPFGFVYVSPSTNGRISYCMKYMRKDCYVPEGKNPIFFLTSRRGGSLGADWCSKYGDFFVKNPDSFVQVLDKWSGRIFKGVMPTYFKTRLFPTLSQLVCKEIRDLYKEYRWRLMLRRTHLESMGLDYPCYDDIDVHLFRKYSFMGIILPDIPDYNLAAKLRDTFNAFETSYQENERIVAMYQDLLLSFDISTDIIEGLLNLSQRRRELFDARFSLKPVTQENINSRIDVIKHRILLQKSREIL